MKISGRNLVIYLIALAVSITCLGLFFIDTTNAWCIISCSIGASGLGAVLLGFFIERSNNISKEKKNLSDRKSILYPILLWLDNSICSYIAYLYKISNKFEVAKVEEFFSFFEESYRNEALGNKSLIKKDDEKEYLQTVKKYFLESPLARDAIRDLTLNRSYAISNNLFKDNEIRDLNLIVFLINDLQNSQTVQEIHGKLVNMFSYISLPEIRNIQIGKENGELFFIYNDKKLFIMHF